MPPLASRALRALGYLAYAALALALFVVAGYLAFNIFVRSGTTRAPDVVGLPQQEAADRLVDAGLALEVSAETGRYDPEVAAGNVIEQQPKDGSLIKRGSAIEVTLSLGPQQIAVPELAGQSLQSAQIRLAMAGLTLGRTLSVYSPGQPPGSVVGQTPAAGDQLAPGETVDALLALADSGPAYVMPDLVYRDYERVGSFFERRGFRLGSVKFEPYEGAAEGTILRQFPLAGHKLSPRDAISLVVATRLDSLPDGERLPPARPATGRPATGPPAGTGLPEAGR